MKRKHCTLAAAIALAGVIAGAVAAFTAESRKLPPVVSPSVVPGRVQSVPGDSQVGPLKGEIRLAPGAQRVSGAKPYMAQVGFEKVNEKFVEFSGSAKKYESGAKAMPEIAKQCETKAYSVQDQMAAGCTGNDTLNQCTEKLYKHCIQNFSSSGINLPGFGIDPITGSTKGGGQIPGFSTKDFLQSAQTASANARALSQLLTQYANEVEQNAKALVP